jgi:hypothetical protein
MKFQSHKISYNFNFKRGALSQKGLALFSHLIEVKASI